MKFKSISEAFNYYRGQSIDEIETRAAAIDKEIDSNPEVDIEALNIELRGLKEARENALLKRDRNRGDGKHGGFMLRDALSTDERRAFGDDVTGTPEYRNAFFKHLLGRPMEDVERAAFDTALRNAETRADKFTSSSDAAAVIPTQTLDEVVRKAGTQGGLISACRAFSIPSNVAVPVGTPANAASWHTEGAAVETEKVTPTSVTFGGYELMRIFSISAKVRSMSIPAFESYLVDELTASIMAAIDNAIVNGTGSGQGTGILSSITWDATNSVTVAAGSAISYRDVVEAVALLNRGYANGAMWAMNNATLYRSFYGLQDTTKRPVFISDPQGEHIGKILGFDVVVDDYIPDNVAILGNFGQYMAYNLPEGIAVEASRESSFKKGLIDYRALAIADCKPIVPEAFVKLSVATA